MKTFVQSFRICLSGVFIFALNALQGQDIHFAQFANSPLNLSPSLAGVFGGDVRFVANYRDQWRQIPAPYTSFSGSVENKFYYRRGHYDRYVTGGLLLNYDKQGLLSLNSLQVGVPISWTLPLNPNKPDARSHQFVSFGFTPMFGHRNFGTDKLTFDMQFQGSVFNQENPSFENTLLNNTALNYFDISSGVNFRTQSAEKRSRLDLGLGVFHINKPYHDFWSGELSTAGEIRLQRKWSAYGVGLWQLSEGLDLVTHGMYQRQGAYQEVMYGLGGRFHLNRKRYQELAIQAGLDIRHRFGDALIPHIEVHWRTWTLGFTYDVNIWSRVKIVTNRRAGPELSLTHRLYQVKPMKVFKSCQLI